VIGEVSDDIVLIAFELYLYNNKLNLSELDKFIADPEEGIYDKFIKLYLFDRVKLKTIYTIHNDSISAYYGAWARSQIELAGIEKIPGSNQSFKFKYKNIEIDSGTSYISNIFQIVHIENDNSFLISEKFPYGSDLGGLTGYNISIHYEDLRKDGSKITALRISDFDDRGLGDYEPQERQPDFNIFPGKHAERIVLLDIR